MATTIRCITSWYDDYDDADWMIPEGMVEIDRQYVPRDEADPDREFLKHHESVEIVTYGTLEELAAHVGVTFTPAAP